MKMLIQSFASDSCREFAANFESFLLAFAGASISPAMLSGPIDYRSGGIERRTIRFESPTPIGFLSHLFPIVREKCFLRPEDRANHSQAADG